MSPAAKRKSPTKTASAVGAARTLQAVAGTFNPLPYLTPQLLSCYHDQFDQGYLRDAALMWERIEHIDDKAKTVIPKRKKSVPRHGYDFVFAEGEEKNPRAQLHKEALQFFYGNCRATNALDLNERGGVPLLLRRMLDATGKKYACHEIVWEPRPEGLTAEFRFVPLWFFENRTGRLRYLESDTTATGVDLAQGEWLVTVGDGLMAATAVCYMYKRLPLRDWLIYGSRQGGIHGKTNANPNSSEWRTLETAIANMGLDLAILTSKDGEITPVNASISGELPYPPLVEMMNRAIVALWRGGDLSTISSGPDSSGASLQGEESDLLEEDDAEILTESLNEQVDRWVIWYVYGEEPLAWIKIKTGQRQDVKADIEVDRFLSEVGFPMGLKTVAQRYNRPIPETDDTLLVKPAPTAPSFPPSPQPGLVALANAISGDRAAAVDSVADGVDARLQENARDALARAMAADLAPVRERIQAALDIQDDAAMMAALAKLRDDLPALLTQICADPAAQKVIEDTLSAALLNGIAESAARSGGAA